MSKGKHKIAAQKRQELLEEVVSIESLRSQVVDLRTQNEALRNQSNIDHDRHQSQMAMMFAQMEEKSSPRVLELEAEVTRLQEELLTLKRSLRRVE